MRFPGVAALLVTGMLLAACESRGNGPDAAMAREGAPPEGTACPSQDFPVFLDVFMDNLDVQRAFTAKPLRVDSLDANADPEPAVVSMMSTDVAFPVIPSRKEQSGEGLELSVERAAGDSIVTLEKPDTDYQVRYYFRNEACWMLYRKEDRSL